MLADPLKAIAGARYSTWETDHFYLYDSPDVTFHDEYEKVIPYAGLIFDISKNFSAFASFTEIFKPQITRDANDSYLDPIDGNSVEFGIKGEHFDARLNTALTLFETQQDNVAEAAFDEDGNPIMLPDGTQASLAIDGTRTRGFEFEASGALSERWNARSAGRATSSKMPTALAVRTFVPRTMVRGFTTWRPAALEKLTLGGGINWQSDSYTLVGGPDGGVTAARRRCHAGQPHGALPVHAEDFRSVERQQPARREVLRARQLRQHALRRAAGGLRLAELGVLTANRAGNPWPGFARPTLRP